MSTLEYRKLRNGIIIALIPIFAVVVFQAFSVYFTMQSKVDRDEFHENYYELQLLIERKTAAIESLTVDSKGDHTHLFEEIDRVNERIDQLYLERNRARGAVQ